MREPTAGEEATLQLSRDGAVGKIVAAIDEVPNLESEVADVGNAIAAGEWDTARAELRELRTIVDDARASATGEGKVLLGATHLVVGAMERALGV